MKTLRATLKFEIEEVDDTDETTIKEAILDKLSLMTESDLDEGLKFKVVDDEEEMDEEDED